MRKWIVGNDARFGWGVHRYDDSGSSHVSAKTEEAAMALYEAMRANGECVECGDVLKADYCEPYKSQILAEKVCFSCLFWRDYAKKASDPSSVRVGGQHYWIKPDRPGSACLGHGGAEFLIRFTDGRDVTRRTVVTHNLWAQSRIPDHFRDRLPDNAEFVERGTRVVGPRNGGYVGAGSADAAIQRAQGRG